MALFGPFECAPHLAVAVSGGRDSLALVLLAEEWAAAREGRVAGADRRPWAAARVGVGSGERPRDRLGRQRDCEAEILHWAEAEAALSGLQEAARDGALPAAARGLSPPRYSASAGRPPCRRPGRNRRHARAHGKAAPTVLPAWRLSSSMAGSAAAASAAGGAPGSGSRQRLTLVPSPGSTIRRTPIGASSACALRVGHSAGRALSRRYAAARPGRSRLAGRRWRPSGSRRPAKVAIDRSALCSPGAGPLQPAVEPGCPVGRRRRSSAAAGPVGAGGRRGFGPGVDARKVRNCPGFHPFRL